MCNLVAVDDQWDEQNYPINLDENEKHVFVAFTASIPFRNLNNIQCWICKAFGYWFDISNGS